VSYVVLGCGAIGATVAACLARGGHDVLVSDPDPAVVAAVRAHGLRVEGPAGSFTVAVPATAPEDLPSGLAGPVLVAVRARDMAAAAALLAARLDGAGFVVCLRHGQDAGLLADAIGPGPAAAGGQVSPAAAGGQVSPAAAGGQVGPAAAGGQVGPAAAGGQVSPAAAGGQVSRVVAAWADFDATELGPGVVRVGDRATLLVGELDNPNTERAGLLASRIPGAQLTERISGCLQSGLAQDAVLAVTGLSDRPAAAVLGDPTYRPLLLEVARQVLAGAAVPAAPAGGFDPADLPGSLARLEQASLRAANPHSEVYLDLAVRHRPADVPALTGGRGGALLTRVGELVRAVEQGRRSCSPSNLDLLAAHERLERLGRPLNAVCSAIGAPDRARTGPLAGRPVGVKDIIAVAGVPTRCGSPASDPRPAATDAVLVSRLREAGAEVFATTQCLEYAAGFVHPEVGDTRNPRDPSRTSGGSSGGSAALVAAKVCDLALGTDTGGSVRIPAAYCGVVGLKPSHGLLPLDGVFPLSPSCDHAGTLTATVGGAADLLAVLANPDPSDPSDPPSPSDPVVFTVGVLVAQLADRSVTPAVRDAIRAALAVLAAAGWRIAELTAPWLDELASWDDVLAVIVAREAHLVHEDRDTSRYADGTRALLAFGASVSDIRYAAALDRRAELTAAIEASLARVDVLAGPTVGYQAPEQDPPFGAGDDNGESRFTGPYNLTGHPAVSLPVPAAGLPAGLQLAGRRGADAALLRVAAAAERLIAEQHPLPKAQL
jgi:Asp-tRNA(Asn)/Glu-tRNA(Gln) amidotransferase A subunit family amidase/ketopantoate reductase